jgi:hypothetical protein
MNNIKQTCSRPNMFDNSYLTSLGPVSCKIGRHMPNNLVKLSGTHGYFSAVGTIDGAPDMNRSNLRGNGTYGPNAYGEQSAMSTGGSKFRTIKLKPTYYERTVPIDVVVPWNKDALFHEATFMNRTKPLNEEPVETYKDLEFESVPGDNYEAYEPTIYIEDEDQILPINPLIEGFNKNKQILDPVLINAIVIILIVIFILYCFS